MCQATSSIIRLEHLKIICVVDMNNVTDIVINHFEQIDFQMNNKINLTRESKTCQKYTSHTIIKLAIT